MRTWRFVGGRWGGRQNEILLIINFIFLYVQPHTPPEKRQVRVVARKTLQIVSVYGFSVLFIISVLSMTL